MQLTVAPIGFSCWSEHSCRCMAGAVARTRIDERDGVSSGLEFECDSQANNSGTNDIDMHKGTLPSYGGMTRIRCSGRLGALSAWSIQAPADYCDYKHELAHNVELYCH